MSPTAQAESHLIDASLAAATIDDLDLTDEVLDRGPHAQAALLMIPPCCCRRREDDDEIVDTAVEAGSRAKAAVLLIFPPCRVDDGV